MAKNHSEIDKIISDLEQCFTQLLSADENKKKHINEDVISKILYFNALTDKVEERRSKIQTFSYQYLAILLTVTGVFITYFNNIYIHTRAVVIGVLCIQILSTLFILIFYNFQSSYNYPFKGYPNYSNQWKWFYYGNSYIQKLNINPFFSINKTQNKIDYLEGLHYIVKKYNEETLDNELKSNLIQMYVLQVHNYYKNKFYLQLFDIMKWSLYISILFILSYSVYYLLNN